MSIQLWYPARAAGRPATYLAGPVGQIYAAEYRLPAAIFKRVRTNSFQSAPALARTGGYPAVVFSPGYGVPHALYTSLFEDLASRGFVVIALDHTYETDAVQFPGGELVRRALPANPLRYRLLLQIIGQRIEDVRFVVRSLAAVNVRARQNIDPDRVGVFGHSLGGLTAAATMGRERSIRSGADLDGSIFGPGARRALERPFMIMTEHGDGTMKRFWRKLRGPRPFVRIAGTRHLNFSDWSVLAPWLRTTRGRLPAVGPIEGVRALRIERKYLAAFFGRYLRDSRD